jgi:biopolymer transport protein ExbD
MIVHQERNRAGASINLIPMIDILSVLVSFLLVYSTEVEVLQNTKAVEIPESVAEQKPRETVVVMITKDDLLVQGESVAKVADISASPEPLIGALQAALVRPTVAGATPTGNGAPLEITIMGDKVTPYQVVRKVMATCTAASYGRVSLAVLQKEKTVSPAALAAI